MDAISEQPRDVETIKSVSLADLEFGRPAPFDRVTSLAKMALMLWGALSFGAAAGTAAYYLAGTAGEPVLVTQKETGETAVTPQRDAALAEIPPHLSEYVAPPEDHSLASRFIVDARLPRPRPDEPVYTGSIGRPPQAHARHIDPCQALARLGARFIFGVRCQRETRVYAPPPPRYYYPEPYRPPYVVR